MKCFDDKSGSTGRIHRGIKPSISRTNRINRIQRRAENEVSRGFQVLTKPIHTLLPLFRCLGMLGKTLVPVSHGELYMALVPRFSFQPD